MKRALRNSERVRFPVAQPAAAKGMPHDVPMSAAPWFAAGQPEQALAAS